MCSCADRFTCTHGQNAKLSKMLLLHSCYRGSTGFVQLCEDLHTGQQMAIKFIPRGPDFNVAAVRSELANQHLCRGHPHIVQLLVGSSCSPPVSETRPLVYAEMGVCL